MTITIEQKLAVSGTVPEESSRHMEENGPPHDGVCANPRCRKGSNGTRGLLNSLRARYCCPYCRVDVCRRSRPKPGQIEKPKRKRKRRSDAKWKDDAEKQRQYHAGLAGLPEGIRALLSTKARRAGIVRTRVQEPE